MNQVLSCLTEPVYDLLDKLVRNGGSINLSQFKDLDKIDHPDALREMGLLFFLGQRINDDNEFYQFGQVCIAKEFSDVFTQLQTPQLRSVIRRNTEWGKLTTGMLFHYVVMEIDKLMEKIAFYSDQEVNYSELHDVLRYFALYDYGIGTDGKYVWHFEVDEPSWLIEEQEMRPTVNYYPFTKEQILRASVPDFADRNEAYLNLARMIANYGHLDREITEAIVDDTLLRIQYGQSFLQILADLITEIEPANMEQMKKLGDALQRLNNESRQWALKGFSPAEFSRYLQKQEAHQNLDARTALKQEKPEI